MSRPLSRQQRIANAAQPVVQPTSLPAPVKGWNTRDALDAMDPQDAILLDNWISDVGGVNVRKGYAQFAQLTSPFEFSSEFSGEFTSPLASLSIGPVLTLAEFNAGIIRKLIAASSGSLFDISSGGVVGTPIKSGFSSDKWQTESFLSRMFFCNGADNAQVYDGTSFADAAFTGVALNTLVGVVQYQQRLFFLQLNSTKFFFAPLNSISGALSAYDLAAFSPKGGNIIAATTFTHDGGDGVNDNIVFIMSSGDALIFLGNDPADATAWSLVGRYRISPPVSPRAVCRYGAEAFITTYDDHVPLQQQLVALKLGQLPPRSKVSSAVQLAVTANISAFGWQALYYPRGRFLIFNIPNPDGTFSQHICNTGQSELPWCRFNNQNAFCWGLYKDALYFGAADGVIYQADTGNLDGPGAIFASAQQAWNTFDSPMRKRITAVRPLVDTTGSAGLSFAIGYDYGAINITNPISVAPHNSPWDTSPWDTSPWAAETAVTTQWRLSGGAGVAVSVQLNAAALQSVTWLRTDLKFEPGKTL